MKKQLVASLAAAMVLGVAGTSFAAANPFVDVPAKHWAYDSVTKLAQAGIVDGYSDGKYQGDKVMSRYEMAQIVAKAMARSDKADASQKAAIDKLAVEFASELEGLNVRVTKIEKNASSVKITGEARLRYETASMDNNDNNGNSMKLRTRLNVTGNVNDQWSYYGRLQSVNNLRGESNGTTVTMDNVYLKGPLLGATATVGRFDYFENDGLMIDSTLNGVNFAFGNVLKANVFYGKENNQDVFGRTPAHSSDYLTVTGAALSYGTSKVTNITGGYYVFKQKDGKVFDNEDQTKVWEAGFNTKLSSNWGLKASYGKSDMNTENKAYFAELDFKGADKSKVGSYGYFANYRHLEANASPKATFDGAYTVNGQEGNGAKGYEVGFNYTPMLNTVLRVKYADLKATTPGASTEKSKFLQAQAEFFF